MKRRIFMLLLAMVMVLGMSQMVFADEIKSYEGTIVWIFPSSGGIGEEEELSVVAELNGNVFNFEFTDTEGNFVEVKAQGELADGFFGILYTKINGEETNQGSCVEFNSECSTATISARGFTSEDVGYTLTAQFNLQEDSEPTLYEVSTGFIGAAISDRGDYNLYIAGYFRKDLINGTHVLALSDITSQTIAIIAHNNANGINRNMNQSTIEEMTITVSGGVVTELVIRGRVQTDGGTLDRYTATINP